MEPIGSSLWLEKKGFPNKSKGIKNSKFKNRSEYQQSCFNCKKIGHLIVECPKLQKHKQSISREENYKGKLKKSLMTTWDEFDEKEESHKEEGNLGLMATESEKNTRTKFRV